MTELMEFFRETGRKGGKIGGKIAAENMTQKQRTARAKRLLAASAKVRTKKEKRSGRRRKGNKCRYQRPSARPSRTMRLVTL